MGKKVKANLGTLTKDKEGVKELTGRFEMDAMPFTRDQWRVLFLADIRIQMQSK